MHRVKAFLIGLLFFRLMILLAPLLLVVARTWRGRMEGLFGVVAASLVGGGAVWLWHLTSGTPAPDNAKAVVIGSFIAIFPLSLLAASLARKYNLGDGPVGTHHLREEPDANMAGWGDVEDDYVWLLTVLATRLDPWLPSAEAAAARERMCELVDAVSMHRDYHGLARAGVSHRLIRGQLDPGHCYS